MTTILSSKVPFPPDSLGLAPHINGGVTTGGYHRGNPSKRGVASDVLIWRGNWLYHPVVNILLPYWTKNIFMNTYLYLANWMIVWQYIPLFTRSYPPQSRTIQVYITLAPVERSDAIFLHILISSWIGRYNLDTLPSPVFLIINITISGPSSCRSRIWWWWPWSSKV